MPELTGATAQVNSGMDGADDLVQVPCHAAVAKGGQHLDQGFGILHRTAIDPLAGIGGIKQAGADILANGQRPRLGIQPCPFRQRQAHRKGGRVFLGFWLFIFGHSTPTIIKLPFESTESKCSVLIP